MIVVYAQTRERDEKIARLLNLERQARNFGYPEFADEALKEVEFIRAGVYDDCLGVVDEMIATGKYFIGQIVAKNDQKLEARTRSLKPNKASQIARSWKDKRCENAAWRFVKSLEAEPGLKTGLRIKEATGLKNSTNAKRYIVRGLEILSAAGNPLEIGRAHV